MTIHLLYPFPPCQQVFPSGDATKFVDNLFRAIDTRANGRVDFKEFLTAVSVQKRGSTEDKLGFLFRLFDIDGTGFITKNELVEIIEVCVT